MKKLIFALFLLTIVLLSACQSTDESQNEKSHSVAVSMYPIEFLISEIAKDHVDVETVIPPGTDPHIYEPSSKKMIELSSNDAFFYVGDQMEAFGETLASTVAEQGLSVYQLADYKELFEQNSDVHADESHDHNDHGEDDTESHEQDHHEEHSGADGIHVHDYNPHFWLDPVRMSLAAEIITQNLIELYPKLEDDFNQNLETLQNNLHELHLEFQALQDEDYTLFVTHKAFGYWTERYGIEQLSVRGVSSSQEPSQNELRKIFDEVEEHNINHIILETISQDRLAMTIAEEMGLRVLYMHNLEALTEENIQQNKDYFDLMRENINTIQKTKQ
ncbi:MULTISPECIES: metal ABC transporter solute-binding protein, Zn/Mn family [Allobacillus]|uniref:Adhesin n=1 Tax=Allobacillus salarius TaxID=1955272 RepID=A0A556PQR3_9BACI|nr:zinc ABC transporter substrate-binding protein [Allobacillus salarius]TSJ66722.1 adhesin [Allobacillus salarius]